MWIYVLHFLTRTEELTVSSILLLIQGGLPNNDDPSLIWASGGSRLHQAYGAFSVNNQAPYPTTRSRGPSVSPELHNESRRTFRLRRRASTNRPATA